MEHLALDAFTVYMYVGMNASLCSQMPNLSILPDNIDYHENNSKVLHQTGYYFIIYISTPAQDSTNNTLAVFRLFLTCSAFGLCKIGGTMF